MKNLLVILLAMFVGFSVVGCASHQKVDAEAIRVCDYRYWATTPVGYVDMFYDDLSKRLKEEGIHLVGDTTHGEMIFKKDFVINRDEYILFVEFLVVSKVDEYNVLTQVPVFTVSLKKRNWLGVNYRCVNPGNFPYLFYVDTVGKIVNRSAEISTKENWIEESK